MPLPGAIWVYDLVWPSGQDTRELTGYMEPLLVVPWLTGLTGHLFLVLICVVSRHPSLDFRLTVDRLLLQIVRTRRGAGRLGQKMAQSDSVF